MAGPKYHLDQAAFRRHVLNAPWMVEEMRRRAEAGAAYARSIAPVDPESTEPGRYKNSIEVHSGVNGGIHHDRAYGSVSSAARTDDGQSLAVIVEYGTENQRAQYVMAATLDVLGGWEA